MTTYLIIHIVCGYLTYKIDKHVTTEILDDDWTLGELLFGIFLSILGPIGLVAILLTSMITVGERTNYFNRVLEKSKSNREREENKNEETK